MRVDDHREKISASVPEDPRGICWASLRSDSLHLILVFMEPLLSSLFHNLDWGQGASSSLSLSLIAAFSWDDLFLMDSVGSVKAFDGWQQDYSKP